MERLTAGNARQEPELTTGTALTSNGEFFFELLLPVEAGVIAIEDEEIVVSAKLNNAALVQDCNLVGVAHCGDAVGDQDGGGMSRIAAKSAEDTLFGVSID